MPNEREYAMKLTNTYHDPQRREMLVAGLMERHDVPGLSMTALVGGRMAGTHCYGTADRETGAPVLPSTVFEAASLTKPLFACMVLRRVEAGLLSLDAPVAPLLPEPKLSHDPRMEAVTPRQILSHATGLPNWAAKPLEFAFDPGGGFRYSGEGYYFLQRALERQEQTGLPRQLEREFFSPWGMTSSAGVWHAGLPMARGHLAEGGLRARRSEVDKTGNAPEPNAAWSLYTSTSDYALFLTRLLEGRGGLSQPMFEAMLSPQNSVNNALTWGLGWGLVKRSPDVFWHWGDNTGYKNLTVTDRATGDGLVLFTNSDTGFPFTTLLAAELTDGDFFDDIEGFVNFAE